MVQLVYKNKLYIAGKISDVVSCMKKLAAEYKTVEEFLKQKTKILKC